MGQRIINHVNSGLVRADDSAAAPAPAAAPALDITMLSNLASTIGSNPQIMSLVTSLLNPAAQKPAVGAPQTSVSGGAQPEMGGMSDQDPNSIVQDNASGPQQQQVQSNMAAGSEPLRRVIKPTGVVGADQQVPQQPVQQAAQAPTPSIAGQSNVPPMAPPVVAENPLNGLLSMLPGVLSSLSTSGPASGPAGGLNSLLGLAKLIQPPQSQSPSPPPPPAQQLQQQQAQSASMIPNQNSVAPGDVPAAPVPPQAQPPQQPPLAPPPAASQNSAQSVINQVLSAYVSGQIPNELIQLGLSGRVPPQVIELALSGQVPPQIIQMIITGQVPMSMINTFLGTTQQAGGGPRAASDSGSTTNVTKGTSNQRVFSTTRSLFEALFGARKNGSNSGNQKGLSVSTLLGNIPMKIPSLPNVRTVGQLVGGTITSLSSMIPF